MIFQNLPYQATLHTEVCLLKKTVSNILRIFHDAKIAGNFKFAKHISKQSDFHCCYKVQDVKRYNDKGV